MYTSRICGYRLFHKNMFTLFYRFFKMNGSKTWRRCKYYNICKWYGFQITIKAYKFSFFWNIECAFCTSASACKFATYIFITFIQSVSKCIRHRNNFYILFAHQCLNGSACSTSTATNNGYFDNVVRTRKKVCLRNNRCSCNSTC